MAKIGRNCARYKDLKVYVLTDEYGTSEVFATISMVVRRYPELSRAAIFQQIAGLERGRSKEYRGISICRTNKYEHWNINTRDHLFSYEPTERQGRYDPNYARFADEVLDLRGYSTCYVVTNSRGLKEVFSSAWILADWLGIDRQMIHNYAAHRMWGGLHIQKLLLVSKSANLDYPRRLVIGPPIYRAERCGNKI